MSFGMKPSSTDPHTEEDKGNLKTSEKES